MSDVPFVATRETGLDQLASFAPRMGKHYAAHRNTDEGPGQRTGVSMLSPYLRFRLVTEEEVLTTTLERFSLSSAEKFIQEVFWRAYFKGYLETRPSIWRDYLDALPILPRTAAYDAAIAGQTGIDCFDFWVKELKGAGYLHNHARMWFASIWIFTLRLPWQLGADFMYRHLIDGDPASNTLSWRWVGGLHTRGKTYLARPDNIAHYTNGRFHPKGLVVVAPPLEEVPPPDPRPLVQAPSTMPDGEYALLLHGDDLGFHSLVAGRAPKAVAVAHLCDKPGGEESKISRNFRTSSLLQTVRQSQQAAPRFDLTDASSIASWCASLGLTTVVVPYAPIGPEADSISEMTPKLHALGISILLVRRRYDTLCWPHATKGFFALKEKIPGILEKLSLGTAQHQLI
jgi:deoxyribodipyrimidine photo-lyase